MNTNINTSILIIISVLCCGCEKENNEKENRIEYDGEVYPLSWGMANYVEHEGLYDYEIVCQLTPGGDKSLFCSIES